MVDGSTNDITIGFWKMKNLNIFAGGLVVGAAAVLLFTLSARYSIIETVAADGGSRVPILIKYDRWTGKTWKSVMGQNWVFIKDAKPFVPPSTDSIVKPAATNAFSNSR